MALRITRDIIVRSQFLTRKNERTNEIISVIAPNGLQIGLSGSLSSPFASELTAYGPGKFYGGISGSLTQLIDGSSFLIAGSNVTVTSASNGAITIASIGGTIPETFFSSTTAGSIFTTGSAAFVGGAASIDAPIDTGTDVFFFISGAIGSVGTAVTGTAVFGGDTVVSGTLHIMGGNTFQGSTTAAIVLNSSTASKIVWDTEADGNSPDAAIYESGGSLYLSSSNDVRIYAGTDDILLYPKDTLQVLEDSDASGKFASFFAQPSDGVYYNVLDVGDTGVIINEDNRADYDFRVESDNKPYALFVDAGTDQVLILSGGAATSPDEATGADVNFCVSGTIGSQGTSIRGTSLFGGDLYTSGSLFVSGTGPSATEMPKASIGCSSDTPAKTALDVTFDYSTHTFENQLADGEGGGIRMRLGDYHGSISTAGMLCYRTNAGSNIWRPQAANATATSGSMLAVALDVNNGADEGLVLLQGFVKVPSTLINGTLVLGNPLYASNDTAGEYDADVPNTSGNVVRIVGHVVDTDSSDALLYFNPDHTWVLLS